MLSPISPRRRVLGLTAMLAAAFVQPGLAQSETSKKSGRGEPVSRAQLTMIGEDGTQYEGPVLVIQCIEAHDPPVQGTVTAGAKNGKVWTARFGSSVEMLLARSITIELQRRPLRVGVGVVAYGSGDRLTAVQKGVLQLQVGKDQIIAGRATANSKEASVRFAGQYGLSCWVRPETLGLSPNGTGSSGTSERVEDDAFQSDFCRRVDDLR
jgi:hypothetical protein